MLKSVTVLDRFLTGVDASTIQALLEKTLDEIIIPFEGELCRACIKFNKNEVAQSN
ncbi:hypothetical protein [Bacillus mycoides]|uniref:hypothetical protein n=1 Tax=Bacillus mycoides TaxID=1405 RepID=UPI0014956C6E|nr:hypothetical protein [Bacillus mycoides]